jgi:hypothetical protein
MCEKNTGKTVFFPFSFFPIFVQICFEGHWTLYVGKKLAQSLGGGLERCADATGKSPGEESEDVKKYKYKGFISG